MHCKETETALQLYSLEQFFQPGGHYAKKLLKVIVAGWQDHNNNAVF